MPKDFVCIQCDKSYNYIGNLRQHARKFHPPELIVTKKFKCLECGKNYHINRNLTAHLKKFHQYEFFKVKKEFECSECGRGYDFNRNLRAHVKKFHPTKVIETKKFKCTDCGKGYNFKGNLSAHIKKFHPTQMIQNPSTKKFKCSDCGKGYDFKGNLRAHIKKFHPSVKLTEAKKYKCLECGKGYNFNGNLRAHTKKFHPSKLVIFRNAAHKCPLCDVTCYELNEILDHFSAEHQVDIKHEYTIFSNVDEFSSWKNCLEAETNSKFIQNTSARTNATGESICHYYCHRSGHYVAKGKGKRRLKTQGSNKIGGTCPAGITLGIAKDGKCNVHLIKTHVGHENDLGHLYLKSEDRDLIATKVAANIPFDTIIDEVRDSISDSKVQRIHLLNKQDLYNINRDFNLGPYSARQQNNTSGVEEQLSMDSENVICSPEKNIIVEVTSLRVNESCDAIVDAKKEKVKKKIVDILDRISTSEQVEIVEECLAPIEPALAALDQDTYWTYLL